MILYVYYYKFYAFKCAVGYVIDPSLFTVELMHVDVETSSKFCDGRTVCDVYHVSNKPKNVHVALAMNVPQFWEIMIGALQKANAVSALNKWCNHLKMNKKFLNL